MNAKPYWQSLTIRVNTLVVGAGFVIAKLLAVLGACAAVFNSEEARAVLAMLPPSTRATINTGLVSIGAVVSLIGAINIALRKRTSAPITFRNN